MVSDNAKRLTDFEDRFGKTHWDFKTEEYGMGVDPDKIDTAWQACRGSKYCCILLRVSIRD
jgi:hypothetical protein